MQKIKNWFNKPKLSIFFYVLAVIGFCYTTYMLYTSYDYINGLVTEGSISFSESISDIVQYMVTNTSSYLFYSLVFLFCGYSIPFINPKAKVSAAVKTEVLEETETQLELDLESLSD